MAHAGQNEVELDILILPFCNLAFVKQIAHMAYRVSSFYFNPHMVHPCMVRKKKKKKKTPHILIKVLGFINDLSK